jgi:integrase
MSMNNTAWRNAPERAGLSHVRVHDLKHTFGRRLRAAGVSFEDRQDLLGHKSGRITTHYSAPELVNLLQASGRVCAANWRKSGAMVILRKNLRSLNVA